jgi:uncharacterized protein YggE
MTEAPVVSVRGEVVREVDPEIATFGVTVEARDRDRQETMRRLAARVDGLRGLLDGYAEVIEKRETAGLYVVPEGKGSGEKVKAYRGSVTTTITVTDFGALGELMLRLADQDQTTVAGPWWAVRPGSPVHREARRAAITDAISRAREYAEALGARVTRLTELSDAGMSTHSLTRPLGMAPLAYRAAAPGSLPQLDLEPQRQQITAAIEARFLISDPTALSDPAD